MNIKANPAAFSQPGNEPKAPHVVVIGSGFGGLASALRMRAKGYRVTLLERGPRLGGRAQVRSGGAGGLPVVRLGRCLRVPRTVLIRMLATDSQGVATYHGRLRNARSKLWPTSLWACKVPKAACGRFGGDGVDTRAAPSHPPR